MFSSVMRVIRAVKALALVVTALLLTQIPAAASVRRASPVLLRVYLYDRCGGCGSNTPGCGDCKDTQKDHGIIKKQLGDRLYDGTITYRMLNCRLLVNNAECGDWAARYGVPEEYLNIRPLTFIGTEDSGIYLPGIQMLPYIGEMVDRYEGGDNISDIQNDILRIYDSVKDVPAA